MQTFSWNLLFKKINDFEIKKGNTSFVNPYSMLLLMNEKEVVEAIDQWCVDGISLVKLYNKTFDKKISRYSFDDTSVAPLVFEFAKKNALRIAIVGTKEEFLKKAIENLEEKNGVKVAFHRNGYFNSAEERAECIQQIIKANIDIVICGMGTPYQEKFLIDLNKSGWSGYGFTCGGFLHQIAEKKEYYPFPVDALHLRWAYRILKEPKLIKRYAIDYPRFFMNFYRKKEHIVYQKRK